MYQVTKRDGAVADFNITKISAAITKAFDALKKPYHPSVMDMLALRVTAEFESKIKIRRVGEEDEEADAKSIIFLLSLGLCQGEEVEIIAKGADEQEAVDSLIALIDSGFGETEE